MTAPDRMSLDQHRDYKDYLIAKKAHSQDSDSTFWNNKKVKNVLGYPVIKKIFDQNGNIILDVGDLITHYAIQLAKDAEVLNQVFDAVYRGES